MMGDWTFFSNYGHVLVCLARNHKARLRDVASEVGITERAVQKIVRDLQDAGFLTISKQGRCNRYRINRRKALRHSLQSQVTVGKLLSLLTPVKDGTASAPPAEEPVDAPVETPVEVSVAPPMEAPAVSAVAAEPVSAGAESADPPERPRAKDQDQKGDKGPIDVSEQGSLF